MSISKMKNVEMCVTLLKEFIEGSPSTNSQKGIASLALEQLRRITAGTGTDAGLETVCIDRPRAS